MNHELNLKAQVKGILKLVQAVAPGRSVELRIPPYAAIQCVAGRTHRRGTPSNVVEMSAQTLVILSFSPQNWDSLCANGEILASGLDSNLATVFVEVSKMVSSLDKELSNGK
jgi:hypothetical protein